MRRYPRRVENYTKPFLVVSGVLLFMAFFTMAATLGFAWVMMTAGSLWLVIERAEARVHRG